MDNFDREAYRNPVLMRDVLPCFRRLYRIKDARGMRRYPLLWSEPGLAKTSLAKAFADELGLEWVTITVPFYDPVDFKGMPRITVERSGGRGSKTVEFTEFISPKFLPTTPCVLIWEELLSAPEAVQKLAEKLFLDGSNDYGWELHPDSFMIATSNNPEDNCGVKRIFASMDNRVVHIDVKPDAPFWTNWLLNTYSTGSLAKAAEAVAAFVTLDNSNMHRYDRQLAARGIRAFPTCRSWETAMLIYADHIDQGLDVEDPVSRSLILGTIGTVTGSQFLTFLKLDVEVPDYDEILRSGDWEIPDNPSLLYVVLNNLAQRAAAGNHDTLWNLIAKLERARKTEWAVLFFKLILKYDKTFGGDPQRGFHPMYTEFAERNKSALCKA